jgi:hypothetical protein
MLAEAGRTDQQSDTVGNYIYEERNNGKGRKVLYYE